MSTVTTLLASIPSPPFDEIVLGPLRFRLYGLCIALGVLAAVALARRRFAARGGDPEDVTTIAIVAVPAGLVGARLYHVITDFPDLYSDGRWWPDAFFIWQGGLGIPGGVLGGVLGALFMARRMKIDWRILGDVAAPALPLAQAIGRMGNYFNQELYGRPTTLPWGLEVDEVPAGYVVGTLFHPTFLYEALWNLALAGLIIGLGTRIVLKRGRWFAVYVLGYGTGRLWVESLRIDFANEILGLRINTWISLFAIVGGLVWLFWRGNPVDAEATAELRAGGDPLARMIPAVPVTDEDIARAADEIVHPEHEPARATRAGDAPHAGGAAGSGAAVAVQVGEPGPDVDGPVAEGPVGEDQAGESDGRVDPQEGA